MPSDYKKIRKDNICQRGEGFDDIGRFFSEQLYSDRSHFIYELLQNAEDALERRFRQNPEDSSRCAVRFRLFHNRLEFRHFGVPFNEDDVRGVSDILKGTKKGDVSQIGKFGIGFKSVYAFTGSPEIHSGDEHFVIKRYIRPEAKEPNRCLSIAPDETVFVFPFNHEDLSATKAFDLILDKLRRLGPRVLLFMRRIDEIEWRVEPDGEKGQYLKEAKKDNSCKTAYCVTVIGEKSGQDEEENWLLFERTVMAPDNSDHVHIEVGFKLEVNQENNTEYIRKINDSPAIVYFPTEKPTKLGFLIQGPYRTTPARDNIPRDDDWNKKLINETAELVAESLRYVKKMDLLSVSLLEALPIRVEDFPEDSMFYPIFNGVREALMEEPLLPTDDQTFVVASNAKLVRGAALMKILNQEQLGALFQSSGEIKWLSDEITQDRTPDLRSYLMQELDVEEVDPEVFARNLSEQFLASQDDEWLIEFYKFLTEQKALWRPSRWKYDEVGILRTKPILRLQDGSHVNPFRYDGSPNAYLAIGPDTETSLPIVKIELSQNEEAYGFLKELGILELDIVAEVIEEILPRYTDDSVVVESEDNKGDLKKIGRAYNTDSQANKERLRQQLWETPFILAEYPSSGETGYRKPDQVYFATDELRMYFKGNDSFACVSLDHPQSALFKALGVKETVRIQRRERNSQRFVSIADYHGGHERGLEGFDPDMQVDGLECAMAIPTLERSRYIWNKIAIPNSDCIRGLVEKSTRQTYEDSTKIERKSEKFGELLCNTAWLPDSNGNMHKPCDLTLDDLPESFVRDERLADQLGMKKDDVAKLAEACGISKTTLDRAKQIEEAPSEVQERIDSLLEIRNRRQPPFPKRNSANPERRRKRVAKQYAEASEKKRETRERNVRTTRGGIDPTQQLREQYTNDAKQMVCQICKAKMPFKKRDGEYYFEAVEALSIDYFPREHEAQFLALCPECAARYKEFIKRDETAMKNLHHTMQNSDDLEVPLKLGELDTSIQFVETHQEDMKTILQLSQSDVTVVDRSDAWSEQDQKDLTTASLQYAVTRYPEEEDLV